MRHQHSTSGTEHRKPWLNYPWKKKKKAAFSFTVLCSTKAAEVLLSQQSSKRSGIKAAAAFTDGSVAPAQPLLTTQQQFLHSSFETTFF